MYVYVPADTTVALTPCNLAATSLPQLSSASGYCAQCLFGYSINCYSNSILFIYSLTN